MVTGGPSVASEPTNLPIGYDAKIRFWSVDKPLRP
jgi:hypothetical protein